ncbi:hypothetical protein [Salinibaculum salinum]|uniref:hypothetical protein n=1 Tax=Salinibaculum salinum TaxID=3131996 RepID=UPI0030EF03A9
MGRGTVRLGALLVVALSLLIVGVGITTADGSGTTTAATMVVAEGKHQPDATAEDVTVEIETAEDTTAANTSGAVAATPAKTDTISVEQEYRLTPDQPGRVDIQWAFTIPDSVNEISTQLPSDATNPRRNGFRKTDDGYVWQRSAQSTRTPTLTYTTAVNQTDSDVSGPIGADGRYLFVDAGDWALIEREPGPRFSFRGRGDEPAVEWTNTTAGEGVIGQSMVYLGPYEEYTRSAHDQRFRLIVPEAATLTPDRDDVFDTVVDAAGSLRVGARDRQVLMFAAPETIPWGVRGLQSGDRNFYAVADEPVDDPNNVWIHEYVHTRQSFQTTNETRWVTEASAEYYAGLLTLEQGRIEFDDFRKYLSRGNYRRFSTVVLSDPTTWTGTGANYYTGALVTAELDRQLRLTTNRSKTFQGVFRRFNRQSTAVSQSGFLDDVTAVGGTSLRRSAQQYTDTSEKPSLWSQETHQAAFEPLPAWFTYALPLSGGDDLRVRGPYRNRTLGSEPLVTSETLVADINVTNVGGTEGTYNQSVTLDEETIATLTGTLRGGTSTTRTVAQVFDTAGSFRLATGEQSNTITVREPATAAVTELTANRTQVTGSGAVRLTATVENSADRPARANLTIRQNGTAVLDRQVRLDTGESRRISTTVSVAPEQRYLFTAANQSVSVLVTSATASPPATGTTTAGAAETVGTSGNGFGIVSLVAALVVIVLGRVYRKR